MNFNYFFKSVKQLAVSAPLRIKIFLSLLHIIMTYIPRINLFVLKTFRYTQKSHTWIEEEDICQISSEGGSSTLPQLLSIILLRLFLSFLHHRNWGRCGDADCSGGSVPVRVTHHRQRNCDRWKCFCRWFNLKKINLWAKMGLTSKILFTSRKKY